MNDRTVNPNTLNSNRPFARRGVAPLEMVLCLPILLFMMALIINFGTVSSWKARCWMVTRQGLTSNRVVRPDYWPTSAGMGGARSADRIPIGDSPTVHDLVPDQLPGIDVIANDAPPDPADFNRAGGFLDPRYGLRHQTSNITRGFPLLQKLGNYHLRSRIWITDDAWKYNDRSMRWPAYGGFIWRNDRRRIPVTFMISVPDRAPFQDYYNAVWAVLDPVLLANLKPLDDDDEYAYYQNTYLWGGNPPDFHPPLSNRNFCTLSHDEMQPKVDDLINRISGPNRNVPRNIHNAFKRLYEDVIEELEDRINADPPPSAGQIAQMEAEITVLEDKLAVLAEFDVIIRDYEQTQ